MAVVREMDQQAWEEWVKSRPPAVAAVCRKFPPDRLYRMKTTGHRCTLVSYGEDGTVTVSVSGQYNRILFARNVFGINPDDLEECDLPAPGEDVGDTAAEAGYTEEDVRNILIPRLIKDKQG